MAVDLIRPLQRDDYGPFGIVVERHEEDGRPSIKAKMLDGGTRWFLPDEIEEVTTENVHERPESKRRVGFQKR